MWAEDVKYSSCHQKLIGKWRRQMCFIGFPGNGRLVASEAEEETVMWLQLRL